MILKPGNPQPSGSPQLTPPKKTQGDCTIEESSIADTWLYTFKHASKPTTTEEVIKHRIYYFAGGGFRGLPEKEHWTLCASLAGMLPEYEMSLVSYPLTPKSPAKIALPHLERFCDAVVEQARKEGFRITFAGDSSGGNIAIVLGLYAATRYLKETMGEGQGDEAEARGLRCLVEGVMAMCPATDMRNENPDIDTVEVHDPILSRKTIEEVAEGWRGELPASDPRVSPILADLTIFKEAGIKVDGVTAGYDTLTPDAIKFREKLAECGVEGDWLQWEKQMHCFPLLAPFHIHEGVEGRKWLADVLKRNLTRSRA